VGSTGLQINIRQALDDLPPRQARHYLLRLAPAVAVLAARVGAENAADLQSIASRLLRAVEELREKV
jgi:hypothetical protein